MQGLGEFRKICRWSLVREFLTVFEEDCNETPNIITRSSTTLPVFGRELINLAKKPQATRFSQYSSMSMSSAHPYGTLQPLQRLGRVLLEVCDVLGEARVDWWRRTESPSSRLRHGMAFCSVFVLIHDTPTLPL